MSKKASDPVIVLPRPKETEIHIRRGPKMPKGPQKGGTKIRIVPGKK
jgi:hypothetical protein